MITVELTNGDEIVAIEDNLDDLDMVEINGEVCLAISGRLIHSEDVVYMGFERVRTFKVYMGKVSDRPIEIFEHDVIIE